MQRIKSCGRELRRPKKLTLALREVEGLLHVVGDDAGGQPIGRVVGDLQRLDV